MGHTMQSQVTSDKEFKAESSRLKGKKNIGFRIRPQLNALIGNPVQRGRDYGL